MPRKLNPREADPAPSEDGISIFLARARGVKLRAAAARAPSGTHYSAHTYNAERKRGREEFDTISDEQL